MRLLSTFLLCFFFCANAGAQTNLVPNPGFDSLISCPNGPAEIYKAPPWIDPTNGTSDLVNLCGTNNLSSVPANDWGWQMPFSGGGYAGLVAYVDNSCCPDGREYIQTQLTTPLAAGKKYCVSFRVSLADSVRCAVDGIGAYFSPNAISCGGCFLPYTAQVSNASGHILSDANQWELIKGTYIAQGGENYITIGNFKPDTQTNAQVIHPNAFYIVAYYFIDDVSVVEIAPLITGPNTAICPGDSVILGGNPVPGVSYSWSPAAGLNDSTLSNPTAKPLVTTTYTLTQYQCDVITTAVVTVNIKTDCDVDPPLVIPSLLSENDVLKIAGLQPGASLVIFDAVGRRIFSSENYQGNFAGATVAAGNYVLWLTLPDGKQYRQKLCIVK